MSTYFHKALVIISFVNYGNSVPPEYCLQPLNKDDCLEQPKRVFSYYRPGSRCEVYVWRGCPTMNKFDDELACSDMCIGVMYQPPEQALEDMEETSDGDEHRIPMLSEFKVNHDGPCYERFNDDDCGEKMEMKYFFSGDLCVRTEWRGCTSPNLFADLQSCIKLCHPITYFEPKIEETMSKLPVEDLHEIDKLIEDAVEQETIVTELPVLSDKQKLLPQKKRDDILLKIYDLKNITLTEEEKSEEIEEEKPISDGEENEDVEDVEESENEVEDYKESNPETLADEEDSTEGSLEEVFTLS